MCCIYRYRITLYTVQGVKPIFIVRRREFFRNPVIEMTREKCYNKISESF
ncbi:hypothetical protein RUMHYD_02099 [Blautia hydrogenotrophica DSM 10507]|uniref:Uncharacterized protein n=1 Tax=Blautia hydrogenotrophica (strain DSM 10507 / JCM 14656 / S5a33) TaxID=476272 RepID=C0CML4_BLAHS|nr:hypothetical protein RUMHYD_02099 [Blautia hydrogenotrophica DSM 10507]